jgi:hypothetical protein
MPPSPFHPDTDTAGAHARGAGLPVTEIRTRAELAAAVRATVDAALARDARTLLWVDPDFADWPLDEPALLDALAGWLRRPLRRLQLLAGDYDAVQRAHPRFAAWRMHRMHAIETRRPDVADRAVLPTLLLDDGPLCLELLERDPPNGRAAGDAQAAWRVRDFIEPVWQRAEVAWPTRPLGL